MTDPNPGVFVNYRRADTGWAATAVAEALRQRTARVFLDTSSIALGRSFAQEIEVAVRGSAVLVALIGPAWDRTPLLDRLRDPDDLVRRELLLARELSIRTIPVLVDRPRPAQSADLPEELRFLTGLQCAEVRQAHPDDVHELADRVVALLPTAPAPPRIAGNGHDRPALEALLRHVLPPAQQWNGNRDRLLDLALAVLTGTDHLVYLAPARLRDRPAGSATALVTTDRLIVVEVEENFRVRGEIGIPLARIARVQVTPTLPLFADVVVHTVSGDEVELLGMFRGQARRTADNIRGG